MRKIIVSVWAICCVMNVAMAANRPMGQFVALKGADGINGINGTDACPPRIYQTNKTSGCYQIKSQAQKRVSGTCTDDTSVEVVTLDNVCDGCTPTYSKQYIHGSISSPTYNNVSANAIGTRVTVSGCDANPVNIDTYDGDDGTSFNYLGTVANCNALPTSPTPSANDAYLVKGTGLGRVCIYTGNGWPTCPDDCAEFTGPAGDNNCTGLETSSTAVKNIALTYSGPTKSDSGLSYYTTKGKMTTSHTPCNPNVTLDDSVQDDPCVIIAAPAGSGCTGASMTYYECKRQGQQGGNAAGTTYNLCLTTTGSSIASVIDNPCYGVASGNLSTTERTQTTEYTAPTKTGSNSYYDTPGKMVTTSVKCNTSGNTVIGTTQDKCEEIAKPSGVCTDSTKVYYKCTKQSDNTTTYNLCATGNSVLDPCAELPTGATDAQKKAKVKSISSAYTLETPSAGNDRTTIGYTTVTKTTCATGADSTLVEYQYDTCKEIVDTRTTGACSGNTKVYLECTNATKGPSDSGRTYNVCQTVSANTSLADKVETAQTTATNAASAAAQAQTTANGKIDASYLSTNGYLTSSSSLPAANLTGTINSGRLPSNVVTTTNNKISASVLPDTVVTTGTGGNIATVLSNNNVVTTTNNKISASVLPDTVVTTTGGKIDASVLPTGVTTTDNLKQQLLDQTIMGTCTTSGGTGDNAPTTSCTSGSLMEAIYNQLSAAISAAK